MFMNALNSVVNFPLYCVSDRVFREHLASLLRCPRKKQPLSTSALTLSSALKPGSTSTADNTETTRM